MNVKKVMWLYIVFLTCIVVGFNSDIMPKPYGLAKQYIPAAKLRKLAAYRIPNDDKVAHFFMVGLLAFLVNLSLSLSRVSFGKTAVLKGSLILMVFVTIEESSQAFFPSRSCSLGDLLANYAGIWCFGQAAVYYTTHRDSIDMKLPHFLRTWLQQPRRE